MITNEIEIYLSIILLGLITKRNIINRYFKYFPQKYNK